MEKKDLRIVYMGTPEFAVESLKRLVEGGYNVVGVITMPDKPMGRHGSVLQPSPVKAYAVSQGLKVLQPEKLNTLNDFGGMWSNRHRFPDVARSGLANAPFGNIQSSCFTFASIPRGCPYQLGGNQWRYRDGYYNLLFEA